MSVSTYRQGGGAYVERGPSSSLADVIELILDRGLVIDAFVRVSLVGIEILTIDARIVVASVDTYLRFAEATNRLDLYRREPRGPELPDMVRGVTESATRGAAEGAVSGALDAASEGVTDVGAGDQQERERAQSPGEGRR